jgi:hypothetical protein
MQQLKKFEFSCDVGSCWYPRYSPRKRSRGQRRRHRAAFHDGPVLVDAVVSRTALAIAPSITVEVAMGFSLCVARAIISRRGGEIIGLAKTNLWH